MRIVNESVFDAYDNDQRPDEQQKNIERRCSIDLVAGRSKDRLHRVHWACAYIANNDVSAARSFERQSSFSRMFYETGKRVGSNDVTGLIVPPVSQSVQCRNGWFNQLAVGVQRSMSIRWKMICNERQRTTLWLLAFALSWLRAFGRCMEILFLVILANALLMKAASADMAARDLMATCHLVSDAVRDPANRMPDDFKSGICIGFFAAINGILLFSDEAGRRRLEICTPNHLNALVLLSATERFLTRNPVSMSDRAIIVAMSAAKQEFPCK